MCGRWLFCGTFVWWVAFFVVLFCGRWLFVILLCGWWVNRRRELVIGENAEAARTDTGGAG